MNGLLGEPPGVEKRQELWRYNTDENSVECLTLQDETFEQDGKHPGTKSELSGVVAKFGEIGLFSHGQGRYLPCKSLRLVFTLFLQTLPRSSLCTRTILVPL